MRCTNCGALLKTGCVYCSVCGKEVQYVPDYSMEEDYLKELIQKENRTKKEGKPKPKKHPSQSQKQSAGKKRLFLGIAVILILAVAIFLVGFYTVRIRSYDGRMKMAEKYYSRQDYDKALSCAKQALEKRDQDFHGVLMLGKCYFAQGDEAQAQKYLEQAFSISNDNRENCKLLIQIYDKKQDYNAIMKLYAQVEEDSLKKLFDDYIVAPPKITPKGGSYDEYPEISIEAEENLEVYYTTDGTDPRTEGLVYEEPFRLEEEGVHRVRAVCVDERGIFSEWIEEDYEIELNIPDLPTAHPESGTYSQPTAITIDVPSGCRAYYSWNGTPGADSAQYIGPIEMIPGNNVLSIVLVNNNGQTSGIQKYNYIYMP